MEFFKLIGPAIITLIGNLIFYWYIKSRIDTSIEKFKISYSGIFKEKLDIHKELLSKLVELRDKVEGSQYASYDQKRVFDIMKEFNSFIIFYRKNRPFLSESIIEKSIAIHKELQLCFDDFTQLQYLQNFDDMPKKEKNQSWEKYTASSNKLRSNIPFKDLENSLIDEIQSDLKIKLTDKS